MVAKSTKQVTPHDVRSTRATRRHRRRRSRRAHARRAAIAPGNPVGGRRGGRRLLHRQPRDLHLAPLARDPRLGRRGPRGRRHRPVVGRWPQLFPRHRGPALPHAERAGRALRADGQHPSVRDRAGRPRGDRRRPGPRTLVDPRLRRTAAGGDRRRRPDRPRRYGLDDRHAVARRLRRRSQHGARRARAAVARHPVRRPLRDRRHRAAQRARSSGWRGSTRRRIRGRRS